MLLPLQKALSAFKVESMFNSTIAEKHGGRHTQSLTNLRNCRVDRHLERRELLVRTPYLQWDDEDAMPLDELLGAAVTDRMAVGPAYGDRRPLGFFCSGAPGM